MLPRISGVPGKMDDVGPGSHCSQGTPAENQNALKACVKSIRKLACERLFPGRVLSRTKGNAVKLARIAWNPLCFQGVVYAAAAPGCGVGAAGSFAPPF